ncbi:Cytochrome P450-33C9 [Aphelenchoides besseyi]|nr:Cytochrome P450-33C9 [Aphelenchoides besseyi]
MILQLLLILVLTVVYNCWYKRRGLLAGPMPFPLFGNLLQLSWSDSWNKQFANWAKKIRWNLHLYEIAVEALIKNSDACSTRGDNQHFNQLCREGTLGIVLTSGDLHREQRKFMLMTLKNFGMGTNVMQEKVLTEVTDIINGLNRDIDSEMKEIDLVRYTELGIGSVIHSILFGYRFNQDNRAEFDLLKNLTFNLVAVASDPFVSASIMSSTIARLPIFKSRLARFVDMFHELNKFVDENIQKHVKEFDEEHEPTDFIDAFLLEMKRQEESGKPNYFTLKQLRSSLIDAWFAGQETSASSLAWLFAFMIVHPEVQQKVHDELDWRISEKRTIKMEDRKNLNYLNAVILESQRCSNVVVQNVLRQLTRDIRIKGHLLRKGTFICPQISSMLWSEKHFPEPEKFVVERFLDQNGQLCNTELMVAFSMGKRACPGESLAKTELFLFAANLLNQFKFEQGAKAVELKRDGGGIATSIKPFTCCVTRR